MKGSVITAVGPSDRLFHPVVPRNADRIGRAHLVEPHAWARIACPGLEPVVERRPLREQRSKRPDVSSPGHNSQPPEEHREVDLLAFQEIEAGLNPLAVDLGRQAQLVPEPSAELRTKPTCIALQYLLGRRDGLGLDVGQ